MFRFFQILLARSQIPDSLLFHMANKIQDAKDEQYLACLRKFNRLTEAKAAGEPYSEQELKDAAHDMRWENSRKYFRDRQRARKAAKLAAQTPAAAPTAQV